MQEIELKLGLDETQERRLRNSKAVKALSQGPASTETLVSIYYDTPDHALRAEGIALRLRRAGGEWVQTLKSARSEITGGLSTPVEIEYPVEEQVLDLTRIPDHDLRERVIGLARPGLEPVAETRFRRTKHILELPQAGVEAELAIDKGTLSSGGVAESFVEAELELKSGPVSGLYDLACRIFPSGPIRFATASKSERALNLSGSCAGPSLRKARPVELDGSRPVEEAAIRILNEGLAHAAPNIVLVLESEVMEGPHQMRVGLRRLRSALSAFRPVLGREALAPIGNQAKILGAEAGRIRDLDVLAEEIVAGAAAGYPQEPGYQRLIDAIRVRREQVRTEVRKALLESELTLFPLQLAQFISNRGWIDGSDHDQTARLAQPVLPFARKVLDKRWKAVCRWGDVIEDLTIDERHEMRKEIKKLRYMVDAFRSLFDPEDVAAFTRFMKRLQKSFGALNDAAMTEMVLTEPNAPGCDDPVAQRAAGRIIGTLHAKSDALWPTAVRDWQALAEYGRFWRR